MDALVPTARTLVDRAMRLQAAGTVRARLEAIEQGRLASGLSGAESTLAVGIRARREHLGITVAQLVDLADIAYGTLYGVENVNRFGFPLIPKPASQDRLATVLAIPVPLIEAWACNTADSLVEVGIRLDMTRCAGQQPWARQCCQRHYYIRLRAGQLPDRPCPRAESCGGVLKRTALLCESCRMDWRICKGCGLLPVGRFSATNVYCRDCHRDRLHEAGVQQPFVPAVSGYMGVYQTNGQAWAAIIKHDGRQVYLGSWEDPADAARAWDAKAVELRGPDVKLNFPYGRVVVPSAGLKCIRFEACGGVRISRSALCPACQVHWFTCTVCKHLFEKPKSGVYYSRCKPCARTATARRRAA